MKSAKEIDSKAGKQAAKQVEKDLEGPKIKEKINKTSKDRYDNLKEFNNLLPHKVLICQQKIHKMMMKKLIKMIL